MIKRLTIFLLTALFLLIGWGSTLANAAEQSSSATPGITSFTSSVTSVDASALAGRNIQIPVAWATANRPDTANLVFEQPLPDGRVMNVELPRDNPFVPSAGVGVVVPFPPGAGINEVRLRVSLVDSSGSALDQRELVIPIGTATAVTPTITTLSTSATNVSRASLTDKSARVPVSFAVNNRPDNSNLVFEQVLASSSVNVELPRSNPIIPSAGNGVVAPVDPGAGTTSILIRLRLVNLGDNSTIVQRDLSLPIIDAVPSTPTITAFTTTAKSVTLASLTDKSARLPVSWAVDNRPNNSNLFFEQVLDNGSVVNVELPRSNPFVSSSGSGVAAPIAPSSAGATSITLRLRLSDLSTQSTLAEKTITVPIAAAPPPPTPTIKTFSTTATTVSSADLANKTARLPVSFAVDNRPANSNLVFEQVDGATITNVELPRANPIIPSSGLGSVAPIAPADANATSITLQLRVIDLASKTTLVQSTITVGITKVVPGAPIIKSFTTSAQGVTSTALLNKTARVGVAWAVDNRPNTANLVFEQVFEDNSSVNIELPRQDPTVPSSGSGVVAPNAPKVNTTTTITIRVRLLAADKSELAQQSITLPIINDPNAPAISSFNATVPSDGIDPAALYAGTFQASVAWSTVNRPANSNLLFEQVLEDGSSVSVELPRNNPIVPSTGTGTVKLHAPQKAGAGSVKLRLRLVNLTTNNTITQVDITKLVKGGAVIAPPEATPAPESTPETPVTGSGSPITVTSFTVSPNPVARNGAVTLAWSVDGGATNIKIDRLAEFTGQNAETLLDQQPASGSAPYTLPADYINSATFQLSASTADGQETIQTAVVNLTCPFPDKLTTDSCPATQAKNVDTVFQSFEKGMMIWRGDTRKIYVLFNDGTWQAVDDTWQEGDNVGTDPAPQGLVKPERGFGKVWNQIAGVSVLGWATADESGYKATWEMYPLVDANQMSLVPHFTLPDGRIIAIGNIWQVQ